MQGELQNYMTVKFDAEKQSDQYENYGGVSPSCAVIGTNHCEDRSASRAWAELGPSSA